MNKRNRKLHRVNAVRRYPRTLRMVKGKTRLIRLASHHQSDQFETRVLVGCGVIFGGEFERTQRWLVIEG